MAAKIRNPEAMGCKNLKYSNLGWSMAIFESIIAKAPIIKQAGNTQMPSVKKAKVAPPRLKPMAVMVWVEVGPGNMVHKELISLSSSSLKYFFF